MNLAIWDIESSSANTSWGSIIEVLALLDSMSHIAKFILVGIPLVIVLFDFF